MAIDPCPADPGYRVLTGIGPPHPADPRIVAAEVNNMVKMVKARIRDHEILLAAETLADPAPSVPQPRADLAVDALSRAVGALLATIDQIGARVSSPGSWPPAAPPPTNRGGPPLDPVSTGRQ